MHTLQRKISRAAIILIIAAPIAQLLADPSSKQSLSNINLIKAELPSSTLTKSTTGAKFNTYAGYEVDDYESKISALENTVETLQQQVQVLLENISDNKTLENNSKKNSLNSNLIEGLQEKNNSLKKEIEKRKKEMSDLSRQENRNPKGTKDKKSAIQNAIRKANDQLKQNYMQIAELQAGVQSRSTVLGRFNSKFFKKSTTLTKNQTNEKKLK